MALKKYTECGEKVSTTAKICPHYGAKAPKQTSAFTWIVLIVIIYVASAPFRTGISEIGMNPQERAAAQASRAEEDAQERERQALEASENERKGFHYLCAFNGSDRGVNTYVRDRLRDPDSFDHMETRIAPINSDGEHQLIMQYRAANGFGGITVGTATATISNSDCSATITSVE